MHDRVTVECKDLARKLRYLYDAFEALPLAQPRVRNDAELIAEIGIKKTTMHAWRNGRLDEHRRRYAGHVLPDDIRALGQLLRAASGDRIGEVEAYDLWTRARYPEFRRRLFGLSRIPISEILATREQTLEIGCYPLPTTLNMVEHHHSPVEGELILKSGEPFEVRAEVKKGRALVVLGKGEGGWFLLAPDDRSPGPVRQEPETLPYDSHGWRVSKYWGPHRIIVIELAIGTPPIRLAREDSPIFNIDQEDLLVEELSDPDIAPAWRWGECRLFIKKPGE